MTTYQTHRGALSGPEPYRPRRLPSTLGPACLADSISVAEVEALALGMAAWRDEQGTVGDTTAVFRDGAFENDVAKSNLAAILEQHGIKQVRSL